MSTGGGGLRVGLVGRVALLLKDGVVCGEYEGGEVGVSMEDMAACSSSCVVKRSRGEVCHLAPLCHLIAVFVRRDLESQSESRRFVALSNLSIRAR